MEYQDACSKELIGLGSIAIDFGLIHALSPAFLHLQDGLQMVHSLHMMLKSSLMQVSGHFFCREKVMACLDKDAFDCGIILTEPHQFFLQQLLTPGRTGCTLISMNRL